MGTISTGQFSLPPLLRNPTSQAPDAVQRDKLDKEALNPGVDNKKEGAGEAVSQNKSATESLNPFAHLPNRPYAPEPFPTQPASPDPSIPAPAVALDGPTVVGNGSSFLGPLVVDANGNASHSGGNRGPLNSDPRPFAPGPQSPFPFPGSVVPGPPVPAPPLGLPPEEEAMLQAAVQSADNSVGPLTPTGSLPFNTDAADPIINQGEPFDLSEPIAFEPNGRVPGPDFFTDFLDQTSTGQEVIDNARIQTSSEAAPEAASEPLSVPDTRSTSVSGENSNRFFDGISSSLRDILSQLMSFLKL